MAAVRDVVAYLCTRYPADKELSKARLTKMVYLADWKAALDGGQQMTDIAWEFNHYGPYVDDVVLAVQDAAGFQLVEHRTAEVAGFETAQRKQVVRRSGGDVTFPSLSEEDRRILDHVIGVTAPKYWDEFIKLVYSTYPVLASSRFARLDLVPLAERYRRERTTHRG